MTENENLEKQIADDLSAVLKEAKEMGCKEVAYFRHIPLQNVETVVNALYEIRQYRAIGTVERFEQLSKQFAPHNVDETSCHLRQCNKCDMYRKENEKYHAIGTIDEFKALKEKSVAKKIIVKKKTKSYLGTDYYCPTCNKRQLTAYMLSKGDDYCKDCGQKIDWSE